MHCDLVLFFGVIGEPLLVRNGQNVKLPQGRHTRQAVYTEMLLQIMCDYNGIGDFRVLTSDEIRFLYDGLRPGLLKATKSHA